MRKPIYANHKHKTIIEAYISMCKDFAKESAPKKYESYLEILDIIIEYHNNYGSGAKENNYWDWLMIIPINLSVMTNGFFAGIETKRNAPTIRTYRTLLNEMVIDLVTQIDKIEPLDD
tara:strand:+ start:353 stop:706 length:354 start_codon:yes stop_codon:yes gene_type:complete